MLLLLLRAGPLSSPVPSTCLFKALTSAQHVTCTCTSSFVSHRQASTSTSQHSSDTSHASKPLLKKLLVANRGEIACRVLSTARKLGIPTVAVYSDADRHSRHVRLSDESYCIGGAAARDSYLKGQAILDVALRTSSQAVHPGYGFLSENAAFAEQCAAAGVAFVGPPPAAIRAMGSKSQAKSIMSAAGVPVVPGYHGDDQAEDKLTSEAQSVGFPLLVKAVSGGGGKGMKIASHAGELGDALRSARREAAASFGDDRLLLERYITRPRHVEVQVFADTHGGAVYLFDRDCSVQRRHQKIIEEAPAPNLTPEFHKHIGEAAVRAARAVGYVNAGTVEFIVDTDSGEFFFMEMNTRLQVEHPVSEAITGLDLVEWQLRVVAGQELPLQQHQLKVQGHAFEARLYAESPRNNFLPGAGRIRRWRTPEGASTFSLSPLRVDSGVREGDEVGINYDPMIAKLVCHGPDRSTALGQLKTALQETQVAGLPTNIPFLIRLCEHPAFISADALDTTFIKQHSQQLLAPQDMPPNAAALAAVARHLLKVREQAASDVQGGSPLAAGPWGLADSKRLWHSAVREVAVEHPEGERKLKMQLTINSQQSFEVVVPGSDEPVAVRGAVLESGDTLVAEVGGRQQRAQVLLYREGGEGEVLGLWLAGQHYELRWDTPKWSKDASGSGITDPQGCVTAPMPGRVVAVHVAPGARVAAGTPLIALEAMKMEHAVLAPVAGTVRQVAVSSGTQVAHGQTLVVLEADVSAGQPSTTSTAAAEQQA